MTRETLNIAPHGACDIIQEHGREWAVCNRCGAQWALDGADLDQVTAGDGFCGGEALLEEEDT